MSAKLNPFWIGITAGFLVMGSNLPDVYGSLVTLEISPFHKVMRDAVAAAGNGLWVWFGILKRQLPIIIFCSLASVMLITLVIMQIILRLSVQTPQPV